MTAADNGRRDPPYVWFASAGWPGSRQHMPPALEGIRDARAVYETIRQARSQPRNPPIAAAVAVQYPAIDNVCTSLSMNQSLTELVARLEPTRRERLVRRLLRAGIQSTSDVIQAAERSRGNTAAFYVWLLGRCDGRRAEAALLKIMAGSRRSLWMQAATSLSMMGTARVVPALIHIVLTAHEPRRREASAYALGFIDSGAKTDRTVQTLVDVLNSADVPRVRAQAAESVTQLLRFRRGRLRTRSEKTIVDHLHDDDPDVRFWCAYAVGELRVKAAVPALRRLARDRTIVPGWWSVGMEAGDALTVIAGGTWPDRIATK